MNIEERPSLVHQSIAEEAKSHIGAASAGAAGVGAAGAILGMVVGGPVGALVGTVAGAFVGGVGGSAIATDAERENAADAVVTRHEAFLEIPTRERVAERAWKHFEERGKIDGHDLDD